MLDRQLQETYGETFAALLGGESHSRQTMITLRKVEVPPLVVQKVVRSVRRIAKDASRETSSTNPSGH